MVRASAAAARSDGESVRIGRIVAAVAAVATSTLVLSACASPTTIVQSSKVSVAVEQPFSSLNPLTRFGGGSTNTAVAYATNAGFTYYSDTPELVRDESFGSYRVLSEDPLMVRYTVADGVRWSDGTAVDAADLLLSWAAVSDAYNDVDFDSTAITDGQTGEFLEGLPSGVVYFDSADNPGVQRVTTVPEMSADRRSITMTFDEPYADWEGAFYAMGESGPPAHVVAEVALGLSDAQEAKDAVVHAVLEGDTDALSDISDAWNRNFNFTELPSNSEMLVSSGPYTVTDFIAGQFVILSANATYVGDHMPSIEEVMIRSIPDPLAAVQALSTGEVEIITPAASDAVMSALSTLDFEVFSGPGPVNDSIELVTTDSKSGVFEDERVREAFLLTVPRSEILETIVDPIAPGGVVRDSFTFFPGSPRYSESAARNGSSDFAAVDIETAQALLAAAEIVSPEVCILYPAGDPILTAEFGMIRDSAALAGITATDCSAEDWRARLLEPGSHDAVLSSTRTQTLGLTDLAARFGSDSDQSYTGFSNVRVDGVLDDLQSEVSRDERLDLAERLDDLLIGARYGLPIVQRPVVLAFDSASVVNVSRSPLAPGVFWNLWDWQPPAVVEG